MAEKIYGLTETDLRVLKEMVADWRHRRGNPSGRPRTDLDDGGPAPETYVARVPSGGIPGLLESPAEPGSALCDVYRLVPQGQVVGTGSGTGSGSPYDAALQSVVGFQKRVYNLSATAVSGDQYVVVTRDKYGFWYVPHIAAAQTFVGAKWRHTGVPQVITADGTAYPLTNWDTKLYGTSGYTWNGTHFFVGRWGLHLFGLNIGFSAGAAGVRSIFLREVIHGVRIADFKVDNQTGEVQLFACGLYFWPKDQWNNTAAIPAGEGVRITASAQVSGGVNVSVQNRANDLPVFWIQWLGYGGGAAEGFPVLGTGE